MNTKTIEEIKNLLSFSDTVGDYFAKFKKVTSDPSCDKSLAGFNQDSRFTLFKYSGNFSACTGYYGNSGCSTFGRVDQKVAEKYFNKALETHKQELFETMAELAKEDAYSKKELAEREVQDLVAMINSISAASTQGSSE